MSLTLNLNSDKIDADGMFKFKTFLGDISLTDLLVINKMIVEEINKRLEVISRKYLK